MFKIGQKVVCKDANGTLTHYPYGIEKNKVYTIKEISKCKCGQELLILDGTTPYFGKKECSVCLSQIHSLAFRSNRFNPNYLTMVR